MKIYRSLQILAALPLLGAVAQAQELPLRPPAATPVAPLQLGGLSLGLSSANIVKLIGQPTAWVKAPGATQVAPRQSPAAGTPPLDFNALPAWAIAAVPKGRTDQAVWLYKTENYVLALTINRLGVSDAIIIVGLKPDTSGATLLETSRGNVNIGDDFRKAVQLFGYPGDIVPLSAKPGAEGAPAQPGETEPPRTYDMRYDTTLPKHSFVVTIRNNRIVRLWIS